MPNDTSFYAWLAAQPAFVEVAIGVAFVMVVAPAVLAAAAIATARLEPVFAAALIGISRRVSSAHVHPIESLPRTNVLVAPLKQWKI